MKKNKRIGSLIRDIRVGIFLIFDIQDLDPKILSIYYHSTLPINENQHLFLLSKLGTHKILPRYFIVLYCTTFYINYIVKLTCNEFSHEMKFMLQFTRKTCSKKKILVPSSRYYGFGFIS